ncbi:hypothetical protein DRO59_08220 [Candidatus Bathyarchaeota archaeon]|nr:MAG: hypothetical protein DRO59_08220 [Candidatus Bathyarchaeota archaeon]
MKKEGEEKEASEEIEEESEEKLEETEEETKPEELTEGVEEALEKAEGEEERTEVEEETPPSAAEEEEVKPPPSKREKEEEFVEERIYTIPLSKVWIAPPKKRAPRAMRAIKAFIRRHMKLGATTEEEEEPKKLIISNEVNEMVWRRGIGKPPRKIRVRAAKDEDGNVTVYLAEGD